MIQITMRIIEQLLNGSGTEETLSDGLELLGNPQPQSHREFFYNFGFGKC
ncbi:MAG: hypothetical protein IKO25_06890 [Clostridia bacterium]|nr:hypothetical protein [Clostridia bacterium]